MHCAAEERNAAHWEKRSGIPKTIKLLKQTFLWREKQAQALIPLLCISQRRRLRTFRICRLLCHFKHTKKPWRWREQRLAGSDESNLCECLCLFTMAASLNFAKTIKASWMARWNRNKNYIFGIIYLGTCEALGSFHRKHKRSAPITSTLSLFITVESKQILFNFRFLIFFSFFVSFMHVGLIETQMAHLRENTINKRHKHTYKYTMMSKFQKLN